MIGSDFVGGAWVGMSNKVSDMRCAEVERKQFSVMLRTNAEIILNTETGSRIARPGGFQHLLKQALELKEEELLGLQSLLELLASARNIRFNKRLKRRELFSLTKGSRQSR